MNNPGLNQLINLGTTALSASATAPSNVVQSLDRNPVWLEGFTINLKAVVSNHAVTGASAAEANIYGLAGLLKEIRLQVNDTANRYAVASNGPALLELAMSERVPLSAETLALVEDAVPTQNVTHYLSIPCWIVPPYIEDPVGSYLGIPLFALKQDPTLEIVWEPYTSLFTLASGGSFTVTAEVELHLREVRDRNLQYYPSEILTERFPWTAAGKKEYQVPESGYLVELLGQSQVSSTAKGNPQNADTDAWTIYHGPTPIWQKSVWGAHMAAERERLQSVARVSGALGITTLNSNLFANFAADRPDAGAFNLVSARNMNTLTGGGAKVKVEASNALAAGITRFTRRVIRTDNISGLIGL